MANPLAVTLHASAAEVASGNGSAVDCAPEVADGGPERAHLRLRMVVTAVSGTLPSMTLGIETSDNPTGPWVAATLQTPITATGSWEASFAPARRYVRAKWTISGTLPSFTFAMTARAGVLYALPADMPTLALPAEAMTSVTSALQADALLAATDLCASYVGAHYPLPLASWGHDLRRACAHIAAYDLMCTIGFRPEEYDANIRQRYVDAIGDDDNTGWLDRVARGQLAMADVVDATPTEEDGACEVVTEVSRGW